VREEAHSRYRAGGE